MSDLRNAGVFGCYVMFFVFIHLSSFLFDTKVKDSDNKYPCWIACIYTIWSQVDSVDIPFFVWSV